MPQTIISQDTAQPPAAPKIPEPPNAPAAPKPPKEPPLPPPTIVPEAPRVDPAIDPDLPDHPGPPLSDPESPHG